MKPSGIAVASLLAVVTILYAATAEKENLCNEGKDGHCKYLCCNRTVSNVIYYGCCPRLNATCCSGVEYCCPSGYKCQKNGTGTNVTVDCVLNRTHPLLVHRHRRSLMVRPMKVDYVGTNAPKHGILAGKLIRKLITHSDSLCPDGAHKCPENKTCCVLSNKQDACCPLDNGVCCKDGLHCCPHGYQCDSDQKTCSKPPSFVVFKAIKTISNVEKFTDIKCPDESICESNQTCCKMKNGSFGCCPLANAVCCADGVHCCPEGYKCSTTETGECIKETISIIKSKNPFSVNTIRCLDGSLCPTGDTCCKAPNDQYGCCPKENAVCCTDLIHCCPHGTTCNIANKTCDTVTMTTKANQIKTKANQIKELRNIQCPDGSLCPAESTCCSMGSGQFGCCPSSNAVCCSDQKHCCKAGYTCDSSNNTCSKAEKSFVSLLTMSRFESDFNVVCPDKSECKDNQTCCKMSSDTYGCCPLPNAVCCSDMKHCCPNDYACQPGTGMCTDAKGKSSIERTKILFPIECPDGGYCHENQTCCPLEDSRTFGCCPMENAVCCSKNYCCPQGSVCNPETMSCDTSFPTLNLISEKKENVDIIQCPDKNYCEDNQTCCKNNFGSYGCCHLQLAVCCSDNIHCCPSNFTCDGSRCVKKNSEMTKADIVLNSPEIKCLDGHTCNSSQTCCQTITGAFGCCPATHAVCCKDHVHCCKSGYKCSNSSDNCIKNDEILSSFELIQEAKVSHVAVNCPDGHACDSNSTCCPLDKTGMTYGCCPLADATCCPDHLHCCPQSFTCGATGICSKLGSGDQKMSYIAAGVLSGRKRERDDII